MVDLRKRLSREELDDLMWSTPETRVCYETARLASQVGRELRKVREAQSLTQDDVAKRVGIEQGDLSRLESGEGLCDATLAQLEKVAVALNRRVSVRLVDLDAKHTREEKLQPGA